MDLGKMLVMQKELDDYIIKEKGLEGQDLFPNTVLALQVELGELANEGRWFKHWSNNQEPRTFKEIKPVQFEVVDGIRKIVSDGEYSNPLLEEFVDCVHFFLSIAIQKGWKEALWVYEEQLDPDEFNGNLTGWYLEMIYFLNLAYIEVVTPEANEKFMISVGFLKNQYNFRMAWICFLNIGINGFGFTPEQIEQAYMDKNAVNHQRQNQGY
jgi:dimeric dUTPase (all-alpha-NTP-PPase superfamily)